MLQFNELKAVIQIFLLMQYYKRYLDSLTLPIAVINFCIPQVILLLTYFVVIVRMLIG